MLRGLIFFANVGESLVNGIQSTNRCLELKYLKIPYASAVTEDEICKMISNYVDGTAGWDDLRPRIMKSIKKKTLSIAH